MKTFELLFRCSAIGLLLVTALTKLVSASGNAPLLDYPDPLFGLSNRHLMLLVGSIEVAIGAALISPLDFRRKHLLLAWLSSSFLFYRLGLHMLHPGKECPCLGSLTANLHISGSITNVFLWSVLTYLLIGSVCCLAFAFRSADACPA